MTGVWTVIYTRPFMVRGALNIAQSLKHMYNINDWHKCKNKKYRTNLNAEAQLLLW